jgi:DNA-binding IclR family transcriptional regulator
VADVRSVFSWSYETLSPEAARPFRLLALAPGPQTTPAAAASLAGLPLRRTRAILSELARSHLITENAQGRYSFHDLLRAYAIEQVYATPSTPSTCTGRPVTRALRPTR